MRLAALTLLFMLTFAPAIGWAQQTNEDVQSGINDRAQYQIDLLNDEVDGNSNDIAVLTSRQEDIRVSISSIESSVDALQATVNDIPAYIAFAVLVLGGLDFFFRKKLS